MSSPTARRILTVGPVRILGDISYSFYLLHLPILIFVTSWLLPIASSASCLATALAATCVTAFAFRQLIELPAMRKAAQRVGSPRSARILAPANQ